MTFNKVFSIILFAVILSAVGISVYIAAYPVEKKFTEFYLLGLEGKAEGYPTEFVLNDGEVVQVKYEGAVEVRELEHKMYYRVKYGTKTEEDEKGSVIIGIINHEHEKMSYHIRIYLGGEQAKIWLNNIVIDEVGPIVLSHQERWEEEIGFAPRELGDKQVVDFVLFKEDEPYLKNRLWINAIE